MSVTGPLRRTVIAIASYGWFGRSESHFGPSILEGGQVMYRLLLILTVSMCFKTVYLNPCLGATRQAEKNPNPYNYETMKPGLGESPSRVKALQYLLIAHGAKLEAGGHYGPLTVQAVKQFQRSRHLKVTGNANIETWEALAVPLKRGSRGPAVKAAQCVLRERPTGLLLDNPKSTDIFDARTRNYQLQVNGVFDERMERIIKQFKRDVHADVVSGLIGPITWGSLLYGEPAGDSMSTRDQ
jgi:peptidoglycan hydrolase-like protein with peptidoglycan-binding domain